jgi:hypothetical protein
MVINELWMSTTYYGPLSLGRGCLFCGGVQYCNAFNQLAIKGHRSWWWTMETLTALYWKKIESGNSMGRMWKARCEEVCIDYRDIGSLCAPVYI